MINILLEIFRFIACMYWSNWCLEAINLACWIPGLVVNQNGSNLKTENLISCPDDVSMTGLVNLWRLSTWVRLLTQRCKIETVPRRFWWIKFDESNSSTLSTWIKLSPQPRCKIENSPLHHRHSWTSDGNICSSNKLCLHHIVKSVLVFHLFVRMEFLKFYFDDKGITWHFAWTVK